jgi:hypothetical protein
LLLLELEVNARPLNRFMQPFIYCNKSIHTLSAHDILSAGGELVV